MELPWTQPRAVLDVRQDLLSATVGRRDQENVPEAILVLPVSGDERRLYVRVGSGHPGLFDP